MTILPVMPRFLVAPDYITLDSITVQSTLKSFFLEDYDTELPSIDAMISLVTMETPSLIVALDVDNLVSSTILLAIALDQGSPLSINDMTSESSMGDVGALVENFTLGAAAFISASSFDSPTLSPDAILDTDLFLDNLLVLAFEGDVEALTELTTLAVDAFIVASAMSSPGAVHEYTLAMNSLIAAASMSTFAVTADTPVLDDFLRPVIEFTSSQPTIGFSGLAV